MADEWFPVQLTERSAGELKKRLKYNRRAIKAVYVRVYAADDGPQVDMVTKISPADELVGTSHGFKVVVRRDEVARLTGLVLEYRSVGSVTGLFLNDPRGLYSHASDPGGITLSDEKLRRLQPELFPGPPGFFGRLLGHRTDDGPREYRESLDRHLRLGDSRAAVAVSVAPLIVAAYSDELDCVALLRFPRDLVENCRLRVGSRVLTVNTYGGDGTKRPSDLTPGPRDTRQYDNFRALIADFLTDAADRLAERKQVIDEGEWARAAEMGREQLRRGTRPRDGRPLHCERPSAALRGTT